MATECGHDDANKSAHYHKDEHGFLHKCYHKCRTVFTWQFFIGVTLSFPLEHALWTKVPIFRDLSKLFGLIDH